MIKILLTPDAIDYQNFLNKIIDDKNGAVNCFLGVVRQGSTSGKSISGLFYEAYLKMAKVEITKIAKNLILDYAVKNFYLIHRLDYVKVGQVSLCLIISSKHSKNNFQATSLALDMLKKTVPIWKKEIYKDGSGSWRI